jgi:hypothetical protein
MSTLLHDLRFALRSFVRAPRFSVPAILALALGIGATSATVSVVRGVMLEPPRRKTLKATIRSSSSVTSTGRHASAADPTSSAPRSQ